MTTVQIESGALAGTTENGLEVFLGVPYAAPPVGDLRWRAPRPVARWTGLRPADAYGAWAPQNPPLSTLGADMPGEQSEDCLTLNLWTPGLDGARPVLVWIHGGGFTAGSGASPLYRGGALARRGDVVVVTINYRLGLLGFLAHPDLTDGDVCANWGLQDQVAALRWVHDNIEAFGGDPGNVTIFGESAGSMSVSDLLAVPAAHGLFHRAVAQSGPPNGLPMHTAEETAAKVFADLGTADLRSAPVGRLLEIQGAVAAQRVGGLPLAPVVDGTVLPVSPQGAIANGSAAGVPLVIGTNLDEWKMFLVMDPKGREPDESVLLRRIERSFSANGVDLRPDDVITAYRDARAARGDSTGPRDIWSAIESDRMFRIGAIRAAEAHAAHQPHTYSYLFTHPSPAMHGALGACHALEIPFVFGTLDSPGMNRFAGSGPEVEALSAEMMDAWLAFARNGEAPWPSYDGSRRATRIFGPGGGVEDAPLDEERLIWA
jgi:para-nitrobenzyl esterase